MLEPWRWGTLAAFLASLVLLTCLDGAPVLAAESPPHPLEQALLDLTNEVRAEYGLAPLEQDWSALEIARTRAAAQVFQGGLSHYDESGRLALASLFEQAGLEYLQIGENLGVTPGADLAAAAWVHDAWLNSPGHRRNILEPGFNHLAIGAVLDNSGRVVLVQAFRAAP